MKHYITTKDLLGLQEGVERTTKGTILLLPDTEHTKDMLAKGLIQTHDPVAVATTTAEIKFPKVGEPVSFQTEDGAELTGTFAGFAVEIEGLEHPAIVPAPELLIPAQKTAGNGTPVGSKTIYQMPKAELREYATGLGVAYSPEISHRDLQALVKAKIG